MKLTLAISLLVTAAEQVAAQFYIDHFFVTGNGCTGVYQGCSNIVAGVCCPLNSATTFFPNARTGSYGQVGFTVWTQTDNTGRVCRNCASTTGFGCWRNDNPFETAFIVSVRSSCRNGELRRSIDMTTSDNTAADNAVEPALRCTSSVLPDRLGIDGREYAITEENRKEIVADLMNHQNLKFDFAEKWKAAYVGTIAEAEARKGLSQQRAQPAQEKPSSQQAQEKPRTEGS